MNAITLDRVLTDAGHLPSDEREILEDLLRQRRIEAWRMETAAEAKNDIKDACVLSIFINSKFY